MNPPVPGQLTAVRVILFIHVAIAAFGLVSLFALLSASGMSLTRVVGATGTPMGLFILGMLFAVGVLALETTAAVRMGAGGRKTQTLLRVALVMAVVGTLMNVVQGSGFLGFALVVVALVLAETRAAKDWFEATDAAGGHASHRPY
ncbi:hypothetical protein [Nocardiopsis synnemataformans]|uniref:hypothetical protein n=1 Tax=Nocardiopsis synnemataformans TaxID=61305 RepID=UPI003EB720BE